jgi:hypothetical protein
MVIVFCEKRVHILKRFKEGYFYMEEKSARYGN